MDTDSVRRTRSPRQIGSIQRRFQAPGIAKGDGVSAETWRTSAGGRILQQFVENCQPWNRERVSVPPRLRRAVWTSIPVELFWAIWLATIVSGETSCRGWLCTVATLDHHAAALLACGVFSTAALFGLIPFTRGFSKCNGIEVIGLAVASAAGGASLLGIAALIIGALVLFVLLVIFVLASTRNV